jgi:hypothetical protein
MRPSNTALAAGAAFDGARRKMIKEVDRPRQIQSLQPLGKLRPNALQRFHFGEERVEDFGTHVSPSLRA